MKKLKTTLDYARWYVSRGFSVIPLSPRSKIPDADTLPIETNSDGNTITDEHGKSKRTWKPYQQRLATDDELIAWFSNGSRRNIGIVTGNISGIIAVDLDSEQAVKFAKDNNFPQTPLSKTGKKGYHAVYRYKDGIRNFQKRDDLPNIDLRGEGGYIVVEPSIHPDTRKQYRWVKGKGLDDLPFAELPEIVLALKPEDKTQLRELYQGVPEGTRNDSLTRLVGSWVNDDLSFDECLENALLWNQKNYPPLDRKEIERTIESVLSRHLNNKPKATIKRVDMTLIRLGDLFKEPEESVTWIVEGVLPASGFSVLASKPKVGKSTIARNLAKSVARGEPFLGRKTNKGSVIYLALEEKRDEVKRHFIDMGATGEEEIFIYAGGAPIDALIQIREIAEKIHPALIIIDPLFRMTKVKDGNSYVEVTQALEPILRLARDTGAHVLCVHHTGKSDRQGGDSVLGSTAIFSSVDTLAIMKRHEHYRTIQTIQRYGEDLEETTLHYNKETRTIEVGESKEREDISTLELAIMEFLSSQNEPVNEAVIMDEVEGRTGLKRKALREKVKEGKITREGKGGKGDPFKYSCSLVPSIYGEHENENPENALNPNNHAINARSHANKVNDKCDKLREQEFLDSKSIDLTGEEVEIIS